MNTLQLEIIFVLIILTIVAILIYINKRKSINSATCKRDHIEKIYTDELKKLTSKEKKLNYIKKCNSELSRNIFFTELQANQLISRLVQI